MRLTGRSPSQNHRLTAAVALSVMTVAVLAAAAPASSAVPAPATTTVELGTAEAFAVLAGSAVTDVPVSDITGDVGLSPATGANITGLTCEEVDGSIYTVDDSGPGCREIDPGLLTTARADQTIAYGDASGRPPSTTYPDGDNQLGGDQTLVAGVYRFGSAPTANLIGNLTLDGNESSVWIFQATSDLVFATGSTVTLTGGAQACNVFWQVSTSAMLGADSDLVGTFMAGVSIAAQTRARIEGRLLADAAVTLDMNTITRPGCEPADTPTDEPSDTPSDTPTGTPTSTSSPSDTPTGTPTSTPPPSDTSAGTPTADNPDSPLGSDGGSGSGGSGSGSGSNSGSGSGSGSGNGSESSSQVRQVPSGAVGAGDGSTAAAGSSTLATALSVTGLLALLMAGAVVAVRANRRA